MWRLEEEEDSQAIPGQLYVQVFLSILEHYLAFQFVKFWMIILLVLL